MLIKCFSSHEGEYQINIKIYLVFIVEYYCNLWIAFWLFSFLIENRHKKMVKSRLILRANSIWKIESHSCQYVNLSLMLRKISNIYKLGEGCIARPFNIIWTQPNRATQGQFHAVGMRPSSTFCLLLIRAQALWDGM